MKKETAIGFFSEFYYGEHHIPNEIKPCGDGWMVNHDRGSLATYDFNQLTWLVLMAHEKCIRVEINPIRNGILQIKLHQREREGTITTAHPTIEAAIINFRKTY